MAEFSELVGKTLIAIEGQIGGETISFTADDGSSYKLYHAQDCCENVDIDDIVGDLSDLIGSPILVAEEATSDSETNSDLLKRDDSDESYTWTFYKLRTLKGSVDIKWYGSSNGYYSESVYFIQLDKDQS